MGLSKFFHRLSNILLQCVLALVMLNPSFACELVIDQKENVGIGTENSSSKLESNGDLTLTNPSSKFNGVTELNWENYAKGNTSFFGVIYP